MCYFNHKVGDRVSGIDHQLMRYVRLYVDRDRLPTPEDDEFYLSDLVGLDAVDPAGDKLYITWNVNRASRAWDSCALTVIHIPPEERLLQE